MLLVTYLKKNNETVKEFAHRVGWKRHTIYRLIDGSRQPSLELLAAIEKATEGHVVLVDFLRAKKRKSCDDVLTAR